MPSRAGNICSWDFWSLFGDNWPGVLHAALSSLVYVVWESIRRQGVALEKVSLI